MEEFKIRTIEQTLSKLKKNVEDNVVSFSLSYLVVEHIEEMLKEIKQLQIDKFDLELEVRDLEIRNQDLARHLLDW